MKKITILVVVMIISLLYFVSCKAPEDTTVENNSSMAALTSTVPVGDSNCQNGGIKVDTGIDENNNGVLDTSEIDNSEYVCNGEDGSDASNGVNSLIKLSDESPGSNCTAGGTKIEVGLDNGDGSETAGDNVLQSGEIDQTAYICENDEAPTNPSISINSGDASTDSQDVTLSLSAEDDIGVIAYYASEINTAPDATADTWNDVSTDTSYSDNVSFTLSSGEGVKTVYTWFKDAAGNLSESANDSITLDTGLITYYPFNGNANDESGNGYDATVNGATLTSNRDGSADSAYSFDGVDDYLSLPYTTVPSEITISIWIYTDQQPVTKGDNFQFFGLYKDNAGGYLLQQSVGGDANKLKFASWVGAGWENLVTDSVVDFTDGWHHVVAVRHADNNAYIYIDGVEIKSGTLNAPSDDHGDAATQSEIGKSYNSASYADGKLDDFRLFDRALSAAEVTELFNSSD